MNALRTLQRLLRDEEGAVMVEYAIITAALAIPALALASTVTAGAGATLSGTTGNMQAMGANPP